MYLIVCGQGVLSKEDADHRDGTNSKPLSFLCLCSMLVCSYFDEGDKGESCGAEGVEEREPVLTAPSAEQVADDKAKKKFNYDKIYI